ncbi:MAG: hypothetical protein ACE5KH_04170 [Candidatus Geothermarchaeales archaeon]
MEIAGLVVGLASLYVAIGFEDVLLQLVFGLVAWSAVLFFSHCLTHYVVGTILGIRFQYYMVTRTPLRKLALPIVSPLAGHVPLLAIKTDPRSLRSASSTRRAIMFASGTVASISLPFLLAAEAYFTLTPTAWSILLTMSILNLVFTLYFSPKVGDLSRAVESLR